MPRLTEQEQQEIIRYLEADKPLPERYRFLLFEDKRELIRVPREAPHGQNLPGADAHVARRMEQPRQIAMPEYEEVWTGDCIFENEWKSFRTRNDRSLELTSAWHECSPGRRKLAVKVVDILGNDTMTIVKVTVGGRA